MHIRSNLQQLEARTLDFGHPDFSLQGPLWGSVVCNQTPEQPAGLRCIPSLRTRGWRSPILWPPGAWSRADLSIPQWLVVSGHWCFDLCTYSSIWYCTWDANDSAFSGDPSRPTRPTLLVSGLRTPILEIHVNCYQSLSPWCHQVHPISRYGTCKYNVHTH